MLLAQFYAYISLFFVHPEIIKQKFQVLILEVRPLQLNGFSHLEFPVQQKDFHRVPSGM
jgi:hypothetical protein